MNTPYGHSRAFSDHAVSGGATGPVNRSSGSPKPDSAVQSYPTSSTLNKDISGSTNNGGTLVPPPNVPPNVKETATLTSKTANKTASPSTPKKPAGVTKLKDDDEISVSSNASTLTRHSSTRSDTGPSLMTTSTSTFKPPSTATAAAAKSPPIENTSTPTKETKPTSINSTNKPRDNSVLISPGAKGVAPPPLPEKRIRAISGPLNVTPPSLSQSNLLKQSTSKLDQAQKPEPISAKPLNTISNNLNRPEPSPRKSPVVNSAASLKSTLSNKPAPPPPPGAKPSIRPKPNLTSSVSLPIRKRCRALYDCKADNTDELSFYKDEIIVILRSPPDSNWWEGEIDGNPKRKGLFPTTHVTLVNDV